MRFLDDGFAKSSNPAADIRQPGLSVGAFVNDPFANRAPKEEKTEKDGAREESSCMHVHKPQAPAISEKRMTGGTHLKTCKYVTYVCTVSFATCALKLPVVHGWLQAVEWHVFDPTGQQAP